MKRPTSVPDLRFLEQYEPVKRHENHLPHWQQDGVLQTWKGSSSREVNRLLNQRGAFWMKDYFDRMIRDSQHFWRCARYIRRNPEKAKLGPHEFALLEAPFVREKLDMERSGGFPAAEPSHSTGRLESRPSGARRPSG